MDKQALYRISYGLYLITSIKENGAMNGFIGNTAFQITSSPARIAIGVSVDNYTHEFIEESGVFAVSVLNRDCRPELIKTFGYNSGRDIDKFAETPWTAGGNGAPLITEGTIATIECRVSQTVPLNTHTIFIGEVAAMNALNDAEPLTYAYYRNTMHGKAPKNAPTFIEEKPSGGELSHICSVCKYVYDPAKGDPAHGISPGTAFEELPDDWKCPVCGSPKNVFSQEG